MASNSSAKTVKYDITPCYNSVEAFEDQKAAQWTKTQVKKHFQSGNKPPLYALVPITSVEDIDKYALFGVLEKEQVSITGGTFEKLLEDSRAKDELEAQLQSQEKERLDEVTAALTKLGASGFSFDAKDDDGNDDEDDDEEGGDKLTEDQILALLQNSGAPVKTNKDKKPEGKS